MGRLIVRFIMWIIFVCFVFTMLVMMIHRFHPNQEVDLSEDQKFWSTAEEIRWAD